MDGERNTGEVRLPRLNAVGLWTNSLTTVPLGALHEIAAEIQSLGYGSVWLPDSPGGDVFVTSSQILAATTELVVGSGIASIWKRRADAMHGAAHSLSRLFPGRFLLGVGVSHSPLVEMVSPGAYSRPLSTMAGYLAAMDIPLTGMPSQGVGPPRVIGALGDKMLLVARQQADGAHPYNVPPEHTAHARKILGPRKLLVPEQAVVLSADREAVLEAARAHLAIYFGFPNYCNNWLRLGFTEEDFSDGGSERLCDAVVVGGDVGVVRQRVEEHLAAGADHVVLQVLEHERVLPLREQWRELAPALHFSH